MHPDTSEIGLPASRTLVAVIVALLADGAVLHGGAALAGEPAVRFTGSATLDAAGAGNSDSRYRLRGVMRRDDSDGRFKLVAQLTGETGSARGLDAVAATCNPLPDALFTDGFEPGINP